MNKPELLLPAGSPEALSAAFANGADAVYLGLGSFSARNRAKNFNPYQFKSAVNYAHSLQKKVYLTVNTLLRNDETAELLDLLNVAEDAGVDGVIIQDWGVYRIIRKHFPSLSLHGSTQMGCHNSAGTKLAAELHFKRIILARELTLKELEEITNKTKIELEIFIHGALCYSFSGYCLFSSWLGGMSANRGQCRQPCRRIYSYDGTPEGKQIFSMKDLSLAGLLPEITRLGITSLKIEGRMKPAEYVARTARAYRKMLDDYAEIADSIQELEKDMGREKTAWFYGKSLQDPVSQRQFTGLFAGEITAVDPVKQSINVKMIESINKGDRIRVQSQDGRDSRPVKIKMIEVAGAEVETAQAGDQVIFHGVQWGEPGDRVFLVSVASEKYDTRFAAKNVQLPARFTRREKEKMLGEPAKSIRGEGELAVKIDTVGWLPKCRFDQVDKVILRLGKSEMENFDPARPMIQKFHRQLAVELPLFIPEGQLDFFRNKLNEIYRHGITRFSVSHFSQLDLIPAGAEWQSGEQLYVMNDQAAGLIRELGGKGFCYPVENDMKNLFSMRDKRGFVPVYSLPALFYSRVPVLSNGAEVKDQTGIYRIVKRDGMTAVVPVKPFSLTAHIEKIREQGFKNFLIDLSWHKPQNRLFERLVRHVRNSEPLHGTQLFNWKDGLK